MVTQQGTTDPREELSSAFGSVEFLGQDLMGRKFYWADQELPSQGKLDDRMPRIPEVMVIFPGGFAIYFEDAGAVHMDVIKRVHLEVGRFWRTQLGVVDPENFERFYYRHLKLLGLFSPSCE